MKTKYISGLLIIALTTAATFTSIAQEKKKTVGQTIDRTAKKVGNKTAEVAVKGTAKVADKTWKGMMAPDGTNVYIDGSNKKYYVNKKGARVYLKASEIKPRPKTN
jgi:lipid-binding SYLF domain-containing protein